MGQVALDGTKVRASASKRKAMSYARMSEKEKTLAVVVSAMLFEADRIDKAEDGRFGKDRRGDGLPEELRRRESRLVKIREAKAALEAQAQARAAADAAVRARDAGHGEATIAERARVAAGRAVPKPTAQRNFTDPDSKIMKTGDGSFAQCYNAQAVVDADPQVIVATELTNCGGDSKTLIPMPEQVSANTGATPGQVLADAGYCSAANLEAADELAEKNRHRLLYRHRPTAPRRPSSIRIPALTHPERLHTQTEDGAKATHQSG